MVLNFSNHWRRSIPISIPEKGSRQDGSEVLSIAHILIVFEEDSGREEIEELNIEEKEV